MTHERFTWNACHITGQRSSWIVDMAIRYRAFERSCPNLAAKDMELTKQLAGC